MRYLIKFKDGNIGMMPADLLQNNKGELYYPSKLMLKNPFNIEAGSIEVCLNGYHKYKNTILYEEK